MEDEHSAARYDAGSGYLTVTLTKEFPGQEFSDLDLLAKLLAPRPSQHNPLIEVIGQEEAGEEDDLVARTNALSLEHDEILQGAFHFALCNVL